MTSRVSVELVPNSKFCKLESKCEIPPAARSIPCLIIFIVFQKTPSVLRIQKVNNVCTYMLGCMDSLESSPNMKKVKKQNRQATRLFMVF